MIITRTPLRISLFGGGTDLSRYFLKFGGSVLSFSINYYVYITIHKRFENGFRLSYSKTEEVRNISEIKHPLVRNALASLNVNHPLEITSIADVPSRGTGLGSSSAFTVGLLHALYEERGLKLTRAEIAEQACVVEIDLAGEPIGKQDQYGAAIGGINILEFNKDSTVSVKPLNLESIQRQVFLSHLILFFTGITRDANPLLREQSGLTENSEGVIANLHQMRAMADVARVLIENGNFEAVGKMLDESWRLKKSLNSSVSNSDIDKFYEKAISAGAWGGKLLGAGGGGFMLFIAPKEKRQEIADVLNGWRLVDFDFDLDGTSVIYKGGNG
jgi:D-glycero-alpha-D-manno-heptose-7-phosphate kinase